MANNLNLSIILSAVDRLTSPLRRIRQAIDNLRSGAQQAARQLRELLRSQGAGLLGRGISGITREVSRLALKLSALGGLLGYIFNKQFIETTAEFQQLGVALESLEGSAAKAQQAFLMIQDFAKRTPLEVGDVTKSYIMLKNAGIGPLRQTLQALADVNAKTGKDQENFIELSNQLSQAWLKQKLQMEEVVVLNERGIAVVPLLAKAMKKSETAITDMIGKGRLGRKEIALLIEAIGKDSVGAAEAQSKTWNGMISTLSDTWKSLVNRIMNTSGTFGFLSEKLLGLINKLDFLQTADGLKQVDAAGKALFDTVSAIYSAATQAWGGINRLADRVGGFGNLSKIVFGGMVAIMSGPLLLAITQTAAGFGLLATSIAANPILLLLGLVAADIVLIATNWDALVASFRRDIEAIQNWVVNKLVGAFSAAIDSIKLMFGGLIDMISGVGRVLKNIASFKSPLSGGESLFPSVETMMAKPVAPIGRPGRSEVGGELKIKIDQDGRARVASVKSNNPNVPINVDAGLIMSGAR